MTRGTSSAENGRHPIAWDAELAQHENWLRAVVLARLGEPQAVDEVMQEVALAAVEQRAPLNDPAKVAPWLYRLAVTQSLLYRRKMGRQRKLHDRYADRQPSQSGGRDPLDWLLADERRQLVRTALGRLREQDAELLLLKYTQGWSYHQIAVHLGLSQSAVEARLHRARKNMRRELAELNVVEVAS